MEPRTNGRLFSTYEVFREGAESSARGRRAPLSISEFGLSPNASGEHAFADNFAREIRPISAFRFPNFCFQPPLYTRALWV
jgi:hypothetical protein